MIWEPDTAHSRWVDAGVCAPFALVQTVKQKLSTSSMNRDVRSQKCHMETRQRAARSHTSKNFRDEPTCTGDGFLCMSMNSLVKAFKWLALATIDSPSASAIYSLAKISRSSAVSVLHTCCQGQDNGL